MPMKSYQFFKIYKRLYKKRDKIHIVLNEKWKAEKSWTMFYKRLFSKTLENVKMIINHFFFNRSFCSQDFFYLVSSFAVQFSLFDIRMTEEISKGKRQMASNGKLQHLFQK